MRILKIKISNFKCFGPEETTVEFDDLTALIGSNSTGKTSILQALQKLFGPQRSDRILTRPDFNTSSEIPPDNISSIELYIEVVIGFPELGEEKDEATKKTIPPFFDRMVVDRENGSPYLRIRLEGTWKKGNSPEGEIDSRLSFIIKPEEENEKIEDQHKVSVTMEQRSQIQVFYVPAIREPSSQLKNASGTILWRIFNGIKWTNDLDAKVKEKASEIEAILGAENGIEKLGGILSSQWQRLHSDVRYNKANVKFASSDLSELLKKVEVQFAPTPTGKSYDIDKLGEGLRSLFYFSLVNSLLQLEGLVQNNDASRFWKDDFFPPALTLLAVEEPENHVAPHLLGRVVGMLNALAKNDNSQVVLTSHSPAIIKRVDPEAIRHLRMCKTKHCSIANKILFPEATDAAFKYVKEAVKAYPELYFARLVVLGEGDTEELIIPRAIEACFSDLDTAGISVVPLGGRFVSHFWKLLKQLEIPYITLLDLDSERYGGGWGRVQYAISELINIGFSKKELLKITDEKSLSDEEFGSMNDWFLNSESDKEALFNWITILKNYGVNFSNPLDLDFMMLVNFKDEYKILPENSRGPQFPADGKKRAEYIQTALHAVLKEKGGAGNTYTADEKELMPWYRYLFLNRGKPSTHIMALSNISQENFKNNIPKPVKEMLGVIEKYLKDDAYSGACTTIDSEEG